MPDLPPVGRPTIINRVTCCPVCLKPIDIVAQDIVVYYPPYLAPYDSLRAYDGAYHRACLYRVGDYQRMVRAWHQGERTLNHYEPSPPESGPLSQPIKFERDSTVITSYPHVIAFERDLSALVRAQTSPVELHLYPRFARWELTSIDQLNALTEVLARYDASNKKRRFGAKKASFEVRPVANHDLMTLRWTPPLFGALTYPPDQWERLRRLAPRVLDLETLPLPSRQQWKGGELEPEVGWDCWRVVAKPVGAKRVEGGAVLSVLAMRLRFVPIWDEEVALMVDFLKRHRLAMEAAIRAYSHASQALN